MVRSRGSFTENIILLLGLLLLLHRQWLVGVLLTELGNIAHVTLLVSCSPGGVRLPFPLGECLPLVGDLPRHLDELHLWVAILNRWANRLDEHHVGSAVAGGTHDLGIGLGLGLALGLDDLGYLLLSGRALLRCHLLR